MLEFFVMLNAASVGGSARLTFKLALPPKLREVAPALPVNYASRSSLKLEPK